MRTTEILRAEEKIAQKILQWLFDERLGKTLKGICTMGQAKSRGTLEQRIAQSKERGLAERADRLAVALAYGRRLASDPAFAAEVLKRQKALATLSMFTGLASG